jgi:hypothetical protein
LFSSLPGSRFPGLVFVWRPKQMLQDGEAQQCGAEWALQEGLQSYVKTWLNQPASKKRRRTVRQKKAVAVFPRPTAGPLRPVVHSQTLKYNSKIRSGQGFTLEELKVCFYIAEKVPDFLGK